MTFLTWVNISNVHMNTVNTGRGMSELHECDIHLLWMKTSGLLHHLCISRFFCFSVDTLLNTMLNPSR